VSLTAALAQATRALAASSDTPRLDAELLLAHALGVERDALLLDPGRFVVPEGYAELIARRAAHEPVAYIIGHQDFWTIRLGVGPGVLIPRSDSETLIEAAMTHFGAAGPATMLDLGTGPGTLLLAALEQWPQATGVGVDASPLAVEYGEANAKRLSLAARAQFRLGSWADGGRADLVLCNPPYVEDDAILDPQVREYEPAAALFAGPEGLDEYRALIPLLPDHLTERGIAILEIGAMQAAAVTALAEAAGFAVVVRQDMGGRDRALILSRC
jgi:release factor glutamine methyltransferase